jgi:hypothetical protein
MKRIIIIFTVGLVVALALAIVFYAGQAVTDLVSAQEAVEVPFLEEWSSSGHADAASEAFVHWDEESPAEVPVDCAKCHSTPGYRDFIGADGSAAGVVDKAAPIGTTVECAACHNDVTLTMTSVVMPSGIELTGLGDEARCMQCHQGRESTISVTKAISDAAVTDDDTVSDQLGFKIFTTSLRQRPSMAHWLRVALSTKARPTMVTSPTWTSSIPVWSAITPIPWRFG